MNGSILSIRVGDVLNEKEYVVAVGDAFQLFFKFLNLLQSSLCSIHCFNLKIKYSIIRNKTAINTFLLNIIYVYPRKKSSAITRMNVVRLFTTEPNGSFNNSLKKQSIVIGLIFVSSLVYIFKDDYWKVLVLLACTVVIVDKYVTLQSNSLNDINKITMNNLSAIQLKMYDYIDQDLKIKKIIPSPEDLQKMYDSVKLNAMYIDAGLIRFIYSILPMYDYSPEQFYKLVKGTNVILGMLLDIERFYKANKAFPNNTSDMLKRALEIKSNCVNNIHNFIYSIPKEDTFYKYHYNIMNRYDSLMTRVINKMYKYDEDNRKLIGVTVATKFTDYNPGYKIPARNDTTRDDKYFI